MYKITGQCEIRLAPRDFSNALRTEHIIEVNWPPALSSAMPSVENVNINTKHTSLTAIFILHNPTLVVFTGLPP